MLSPATGRFGGRIAVRRIWEGAKRHGQPANDCVRAALTDLFPRSDAWHRYLATERDTEKSGLVTIVHTWEGIDNLTRGDAPPAAMAVCDLPPSSRLDLRVGGDTSERPTKAEYDRYLWSVEGFKRARYDPAIL